MAAPALHHPVHPRLPGRQRGGWAYGSPGAPAVTTPGPPPPAPPAVTTYTSPIVPAVDASTNVTVSTTAGQWLFCVVAWRGGTGYPAVDIHVEDSAHNWWEPMGAPGGTSPATGDIRIAVWRSPAARATTLVSVAPNGFVLSTAAAVIQVEGISQWVAEVSTVTAYQASATSLGTLTPTAPSSTAFWLTAVARDSNPVTTSFPTGWTPGPMTSTSDGVDHSSDLTLMTAFTETAGTPSATWSGTAACDMAGIVTGVLVQAPMPAQPDPNWPIVQFQVAPGAGVATPASETTWVATDPSPFPRFLDFELASGQEYEVDSLQAGEGQVTLANPDLALVPPGTGDFTGVDSATPWRLLCAWPGATPVGSSNPTPWYVIRGFFERFPPSWDSETWYGIVGTTILDTWAYCQAQMQSCLRSEILADNPKDYWPLGEPAGSVYASNLAPGSAASLVQMTSPYGAGTVTAAFGSSAVLSSASAAVQSQAGGLPGDGGTVWEQASLPTGATSQGYVLYCQDPGFPALNATAGASVEVWFALTGVTPATTDGTGTTSTTAAILYQDSTIWAVKNTKGLVVRCWADTSGMLHITTQDTTGAQVSTALGTASWLGAGLTQVVWTWVAGTGWVAYLNGTQVAASAAAPSLAPAFAWLEAGGEQDRFTNAYCMAGQAAHVAVFGQALPATRVAAHYQGGALGMAQEAFPSRVERLLSYGGYAGRRVIETSAVVDECASLSDLGTTTSTGVASGVGVPVAAGQGTVQAAQEISALVASATPAMVYVAPTGAVCCHAKGQTYGEAVKWVLGDEPANGEIPYQPDAAFDYDPQRLLNDILITQLDRQDVIAPQALSPNAAGALTEAASQAKYGQTTYQITGYLFNDLTTPVSSATPANLLDLANWLALSYAAPHLRVQQITVDASSYPQAWPLVLSVSPGDIATVHRRPPQAAGAAISLTARVMHVDRSLKRGGREPEGTAQVILVLDYAPELNPLTLNDPVRGLLSGSNVLTW